MSAVDRVLLLIKKYIMEDTRSITVYKRLKQQITESNESKKRRTIAKLNVQRTKTKTKQKIPTGIKIILIRKVSWEYNNVDVLPLRRKPLLTREREKEREREGGKATSGSACTCNSVYSAFVLRLTIRFRSARKIKN